MSLTVAVLLFLAGILSGMINAVAGGGTFITFGALSLVGVPPISANATSSLTQFPGYVTSALAYWRDIRTMWREGILLAAMSAIGALAGALILIALENRSFRVMVPWLLLAATALFAAGPWLKPASGLDRAASPAKGAVIQFLTAVYGGFFGAGMGIMMLAALSIIESGNFHKANSIKLLTGFLIQMVSAAVLIAGGLVHWPHAIVTIAASAVGGYYGAKLARKVPERIIRAAVVTVGAVLTVLFFLK